MLQKAVREFANKKIAPNVDQWDEEHYFPYEEAIKPMGELGFFGTVSGMIRTFNLITLFGLAVSHHDLGQFERAEAVFSDALARFDTATMRRAFAAGPTEDATSRPASRWRPT